MNHEAKKKLTRARTALLLDSPFFGTLLLRLKVEERADLPTAGTDGDGLYYNPSFINTLPDDHLKAVLAHEVLHVALLHHTRRENRNPMRWNVAADLAINPILRGSGFLLPSGALFNPALAGQTAEEIYKQLPEPPKGGSQGKKKSKGNGQPRNGSDNGSGDNPDPGGMGQVMDTPHEGQDQGRGITQEERAQAEERAKIAVQQAAQAAKMAGLIPGGLQRLVDEIVNPRLPWREILRRFINSNTKSDYTWTVPNRRYISQGIYLPSMHSQALERLVLAIDTSGSIDKDALNQFSAELSAILDYLDAELTVIYCDSKVQGVETFTKSDLPLKLKPKGGGGTSFRPVFDYIEKHNLDPSVMIYFTDLECYLYPDQAPAFPVLWAVWGFDGRDLDHPRFGEVMRIK